MDINDQQQINTFIKGMNTDTSDALIDSSQYRFAENLRLTTNTDNNSGELHMIDGNKEFSIYEQGVLEKKVIACTSIREYGIAIVVDSTNKWYVYRFTNQSNSAELLFGPCQKKIWEGNDPDNASISLLTRYESSNNIKLYIADGIHELMTVRIDTVPSTPPTDIQNILGISHAVLPPLDVSISTVNGTLAPARVQYCYRLYSKFGSITKLSALSKPLSLYKDQKSGYSNTEKTERSVSIQMPNAQYQPAYNDYTYAKYNNTYELYPGSIIIDRYNTEGEQEIHVNDISIFRQRGSSYIVQQDRSNTFYLEYSANVSTDNEWRSFKSSFYNSLQNGTVIAKEDLDSIKAGTFTLDGQHYSECVAVDDSCKIKQYQFLIIIQIGTNLDQKEISRIYVIDRDTLYSLLPSNIQTSWEGSIDIPQNSFSAYTIQGVSESSPIQPVPVSDRLDMIQIYRITYAQTGQLPTVNLIYDGKYTVGDSFLDTGYTDISPVAVSEFLSYIQLGIIPKLIESKNNYLFAANVGYTQVNVDQLFEDVDATTTYSNSNRTAGDGQYFQWRVTSGSSYTIGKGNQSSSYTQQNLAFRPGEVYRFGVVFYDEEGNTSSVKHIQDIQMPDYNNYGYNIITINTNNPQSTYYSPTFLINPPTIEFRLKRSIAKCSRYEIVRCLRTLNDKYTITQGLIGRPLQVYNGDEEATPEVYTLYKLNNVSGQSKIFKAEYLGNSIDNNTIVPAMEVVIDNDFNTQPQIGTQYTAPAIASNCNSNKKIAELFGQVRLVDTNVVKVHVQYGQLANDAVGIGVKKYAFNWTYVGVQYTAQLSYEEIRSYLFLKGCTATNINTAIGKNETEMWGASAGASSFSKNTTIAYENGSATISISYTNTSTYQYEIYGDYACTTRPTGTPAGIYVKFNRSAFQPEEHISYGDNTNGAFSVDTDTTLEECGVSYRVGGFEYLYDGPLSRGDELIYLESFTTGTSISGKTFSFGTASPDTNTTQYAIVKDYYFRLHYAISNNATLSFNQLTTQLLNSGITQSEINSRIGSSEEQGISRDQLPEAGESAKQPTFFIINNNTATTGDSSYAATISIAYYGPGGGSNTLGQLQATNKICPSGLMTIDYISVSDRKASGSDQTVTARPVSRILQFASPEYLYQPDDVRNIFDTYAGNLSIAPVCSYNCFTKYETYDGNAYVRTVSSNLNNMPISFRLKQIEGYPGSYIASYDMLAANFSRYYRDDVLTPFQRSDIEGRIAFNYITPYSINSDRHIEQQHILDMAYVESPEWNSISDGTTLRFKDDVTNIGTYLYTGWSAPCLLETSTGTASALHSYMTSDNHDATYWYNVDTESSLYPQPEGGENRKASYGLGTTGSCVLMQVENEIPTYYVQSSTYTSDSRIGFPSISVVDIKKPAIPYGGSSENSIKNSVYYSFGESFLVSGSGWNKLSCGDCYIKMFNYNALHNWFDTTFVRCVKMGTVYSVPLCMDVDPQGEFGHIFNISQPKAYYIQDEAAAFDGYVQSKDCYLYNTAYSTHPDIFGYHVSGTQEIDSAIYDTRVHYSGNKTNGESFDSWLQFKTDDFLDVDTRYGAITDLRLFKDKLMFWQDSATGILAVNERVILQNTDDTQVVLGTGSVLERYDYITTVYGMKPDQLADTQSNDALYWWDGYNKEILQYQEKYAATPLSTIKYIRNYLNSNGENAKPHLVYDNKNKEVICQCVNNESVVYNEYVQAFTSVYKFTPQHSLNINDVLYTAYGNKFYEQNKQSTEGEAKLFNDRIYPYISYVVNKNNTIVKTFDIQTMGGSFYGNSTEENADANNINKIQNLTSKWHSSFEQGKPLYNINIKFKTPLNQEGRIINGNGITNREYDFRLNVPRQGKENNNSWVTESYGDRLKGKTMQCELSSISNSTDFSLQYVTTKYRISWS